MSEADRRRTPRQTEAVPASLTFTVPMLAGTTVDTSRGGVRVRANGRLAVQVQLKGQTYRGRLVRATPSGPDATDYAIELTD